MAEPWKRYKPWDKYGKTPKAVEEKPKKPVEATEFEREARDITKGDTADFIAGLPQTRFAMGAGGFVPAAAQIAGNIADTVGSAFGMRPGIGEAINAHMKQLQEMSRRGMVMQGQGRDDWDVAGIVGAGASPAALGALKALPQASTALARYGSGAGLGAAFGALTPVSNAESTGDFWADKVAQTGGGALFGAILPAGIDFAKLPFKTLWNIIEPWVAGPEGVLKRTLDKGLGETRKDVLKALQGRARTEIGKGETTAVAGSKAGSAELSAMEELLQQMRPSEYRRMARIQNNARLNALGRMSGTDEELAAAISNRQTKAKKLYDEAFKEPMPWSKDLQDLMNDPFIMRAEKEASDLIEKAGVGPGQRPVEYLHLLKEGLDSVVNKAAAGKGSLATTKTHSAADTRAKLMEILGQSKGYTAARQGYAEMSQPINQMSVARVLAGRLRPAGQEFGAETIPQNRDAFLRAMQDAPGVIKSASGRNLYSKLEDVMSPEQMLTIKDIARNLGAESESTALGGAGLQKIAKEFSAAGREFKGLPVLARTAMIANAILGRLQGRANEKVLLELSKRFQNPDEIQRLLQEMTPSARRQIMDEVSKHAKRIGFAGAVTAGARQQ